MSNSHALNDLSSLDWNEPPLFALHEWRARIKLLRGGGKSLQVEYMNVEGCRTMLVSVVLEDSSRTYEVVVPLKGMRQLRTLLNYTDLDEDNNYPPGEQT